MSLKHSATYSTHGNTGSYVTDSTPIPQFKGETMSQAPRDINKVIPKILEALPEKPREDDKEAVEKIRTALARIAEHAQYKPPEMQQDSWTTLTSIIRATITEPPSKLEHDSWQAEVVQIFTKKSVTQLRLDEQAYHDEQERKRKEKE